MNHIYFIKAKNGYLYGRHIDPRTEHFVSCVGAVHGECIDNISREYNMYVSVTQFSYEDHPKLNRNCMNCNKPLIHEI